MNLVVTIVEDAKRYSEHMGWSLTRFCNEAGIHPALGRNFSNPNWNPRSSTLRKMEECIERGKSIIPVPTHCLHPERCRADGFKHCGKCGALVRIYGSTEAAVDRSKMMAALYRDGYTLNQIAEQYNLTRERVRQVLTGEFGITAKDGGQRQRAAMRKAEKRAEQESACLQRHGCTLDQYRDLLDIGRRMMAGGESRARTPTGAFQSQRNNARNREIAWELSLWEWWTIWQASGHWEERGRGQGYVMCRTGDTGPYSVGNVFIALARDNNSRTKNKKSGLPIGVQNAPTAGHYKAKRMVNGEVHDLGTFPSPELAHAAYLAAAP